MPLLDVSDIVTDPDFADTFDVIRTTVGVGSGGRNEVTATQTFPGVVGTVTQNAGVALQRLAEGERTTSIISVLTPFRLTDGAGPLGADQVVWSGRTYTVMNVSDWSRFGAGFVRALCEQHRLNL